MADRKADDRPTPSKPIRRFDVFAEVKRLEALDQGRAEDEAKGYGVWIAKVVAARRFGKKADDAAERRSPRQPGDADPRGGGADRFRSVGNEVQTDETFDREIVDRMGRAFYDRVFAPAVREAVRRGERYEQFRDAIRAGWKPGRR